MIEKIQGILKPDCYIYIFDMNTRKKVINNILVHRVINFDQFLKYNLNIIYNY